MPSERVQRRIDGLLDDAEEAAARRDWEEVSQSVRMVLRLDPENADAIAFETMLEGEVASALEAPGGLSNFGPGASKLSPLPVEEGRGEGEGHLAPTLPPLPTAGEGRGEGVPTPTSFAKDRYRVSKFLGEGGKKRVYQAHDTLLDREVAFALIKNEGFDQTSKERISREAQAMGRLGVHPNIVAVLDLGQEDDGTPYMVTELMGGGDVEGLLDIVGATPRGRPGGDKGEGASTTDTVGATPRGRPGGGPDAGQTRGSAPTPGNGLSLDRTIEIAKAVCEGLEFAHARGIVHRDLKPGNVWLTEEGIAKIGDFGLAVMTDRSRLTREGMMVGTVSYMPPEQATGGEITAKADLYSLGAMLYEMVTGRPPFLGDDEIAIIGQHINTPPVAPTWHNSDCPRPLEALIMRLLAKDPAERPESAQDVFNALDAIVLTARGESIEQDQTSLESLAGGVFVGRQAEMDKLKTALEDVLGGRGRLVTLVGEPGIGKTRTSEELATYAGLRGAQVLWGRCYETGGQPPYWPWVQAIRSYVREIDAEELRRQMGSSASVVAEIVTDVKERLPGLQPPQQLDDPDSARFRLFDGITSFLKTASQARPLVLILDDLHWSDRPSLTFLEFMAREIGQSRVLLICTYRDMELNRRHPLTLTLGDLARERLYERVVLRGLSESDVGRFIEIAAGVLPPAELSATVHRHTEGNPLFVTEVVRELVQSGDLAEKRASGNATWSVRIPEGVREVIGRRLDRLSERANEILTTAAVVGRDFALDVLKNLTGDATEGQLLDVLDEVMDARLIEELPDAIGHYQFTHALIQDTLTSELSITRRVRMHARIAEALESIYGDDADANAAEPAHHFVEAQTVLGPERLVHYSFLAGDRALNARAYEEAEAHLQRALAGKGLALTGTEPAKDGEAAALLSCLGQAQVGTLSAFGGITASTTLGRAFDYYVSVGDVARAVDIAASYMPINTGLEQHEKALELVPADSHDAGRLLSRTILSLRPEYDRVQEAADGALAIARQRRDPELEMRTLVDAGCVDISHCRFQECLDRDSEAIQLVRHVELPFDESHALFDLSRAASALGDLGEAARFAEAILEVADRSGNRHIRALARDTNQSVCRAKGDWQAARDFADQGLALMPTESNLLGGRALLEYAVGDFEAGESYLNELLAIQQAQSEVPPLFPTIGTWTVPIVVIPLVARITEVPDCYDVLEAAARSIISSPDVYPGASHGARIGLALIAIQRGDGDAARDLYDALQELRGAMYPQAPVGPEMSIDRLLGLLAQTTAKPDLAAQHFEDSLTFCRMGGYRPELAWSCSDYAEMLLDQDDPSSASGRGDREKAIGLQDEALAITQELGMRPLTERILARREILRA